MLETIDNKEKIVAAEERLAKLLYEQNIHGPTIESTIEILEQEELLNRLYASL